MSSRIKITLPEHVAEALDELAAAEGERLALNVGLRSSR
jgi:metal-responsive CopG/Arc/MetJ family transcriptional regulator